MAVTAGTADLADMPDRVDMGDLAGVPALLDTPDPADMARMDRCASPKGRSIGSRGRVEGRTMADSILAVVRATRCLSTG
jgi:hypothetical protein